MSNTLVVKSSACLPCKQLQGILDSLKAQKETGVILLPSYLEAQIVPDDIKIKLTGPDDSEIMLVDADKKYLKRRKAATLFMWTSAGTTAPSTAWRCWAQLSAAF